MADSSHTKQKIQSHWFLIAFQLLQCAFLPLSFMVAAANQVCVAACICSFLRNPLALNFARFAHKISGCGGREVFVCSGREVCVSACRSVFRSGSSCCRRARTPQISKTKSKTVHIFQKRNLKGRQTLFKKKNQKQHRIFQK
ncbi:hypothetical protein [Methanimicrococcus hongohii]|uniref:hypothetical protein n=1 Tax=Methanimicrococcus hongohii TaxID=3028295 RepID=UPI00292FDCBC|nr:hypothetical protein [Methanimicrococcus sp. Hf6]